MTVYLFTKIGFQMNYEGCQQGIKLWCGVVWCGEGNRDLTQCTALLQAGPGESLKLAEVGKALYFDIVRWPVTVRPSSVLPVLQGHLVDSPPVS